MSAIGIVDGHRPVRRQQGAPRGWRPGASISARAPTSTESSASQRLRLVADLAEVEDRDPRLLVERRGEVALEGLGRTVGILDRELDGRKDLRAPSPRPGRSGPARAARGSERAGAQVQGDRDVVFRGGQASRRGPAPSCPAAGPAAAPSRIRDGRRAQREPDAAVALAAALIPGSPRARARCRRSPSCSASGRSAARRSGLVMPVATATARTPRLRPQATSWIESPDDHDRLAGEAAAGVLPRALDRDAAAADTGRASRCRTRRRESSG